MVRTQTIGLLVAACVVTSPALAGVEEAYKAYRSRDFTTAINEARAAAQKGDAYAALLLGGMYQTGQGVPANSTEATKWFEKAAQGGVPMANGQLARIYGRGEGVARDPEKALTYARRGAQLGDAESQFAVFALLNSGPLGYLDASGQPDQNRYHALARRDPASRTLDTEARDALYRAAAQNSPPAQMMLIATLASTVGDGNNTRIRSITLPRGGAAPQPIEKYQSLGRHMASLGESLTSPQLFLDVQMATLVAATLQTCPKGSTPTGTPRAELSAITISKPLSGARYLPTTVAGYERAYLLAGAWEERWTFRGCGRTANVRVKFTADGLGGATYSATQDGVR